MQEVSDAVHKHGTLVKLEVRRAEELLTSPTVTVILQGEISDKATEVGGL